MLRHVFRPALAPIITFLGPLSMEMLAGSLIVEGLYGFPGFGRSFFTAVLELDYPMILGLTVVYASGILIINLLVEVACELIDPRLRAGRPQRAQQ
jgi:oligopeptide transport system permease protein